MKRSMIFLGFLFASSTAWSVDWNEFVKTESRIQMCGYVANNLYQDEEMEQYFFDQWAAYRTEVLMTMGPGEEIPETATKSVQINLANAEQEYESELASLKKVDEELGCAAEYFSTL